MIFSHDKKETIRTVDSLVSIVVQLIQLAVTSYGLWYVMHHPH